MIMGDSTSLFRKTYLSPEGKGLSSTGCHVGFSNLGSSRVSSSLSSSSLKSLASLSRSDYGESDTETAKTSSSGSIAGSSPVARLTERVIGTK